MLNKTNLNTLPDEISIKWHIEDVKALDDNLTDDQCRKILQSFERHHEGSMEQMWLDLEYHIQEFKDEN